MKKCTSAVLVAAALASGYVNAAGMDDIKISGFGSVGVGIANNDSGYASYAEKVDTKQDTLLGLQFDFKINDKAKVTTQLVANGRYDFDPAIEVAYLSYQINSTTLRGGKLRTPFFMYSDYLDVGYAYPMLRPSQEIYEHLIVSNFTGVDALIPVAIGDTTLQLQPFVGVSQVDKRDSSFGQQIDINDMIGLTANWYIGDWTVRGSYVQGESGDSAIKFLEHKESSFTAVGVQYNNGSLLFNLEGTRSELDGPYADVDAISGLVGYQVGEFTPYLAAGWLNSTDDSERSLQPKVMRTHERTSYSMGTRWDFARNMALKLDVTYADFQGTTGGLASNLDNKTFKPAEDNTLVYSASIDFVF